jgi:hypothetical protein
MRKLRFVIAALIVVASILTGQDQNSPKWVGTWILDTKKSTFQPGLMPGIPNFSIVSQTLKIEQTTSDIRLSGETVTSLSATPSHEQSRLNLDGSKTMVGPISLAFKRIDDSTFEITSAAKIRDSAFTEVSRYVVSSDGKVLTGTKTQSEGDRIPEQTVGNQGASVRTSRSVLVYNRAN